jgi:predicted dehydrogenase
MTRTGKEGKCYNMMKRRQFIGSAAALTAAAFLPSSVWAVIKRGKIRTAHIGVGGQGASDLDSIASHPAVEVAALCDVDATRLAAASKKHPGARTFSDYRVLFDKMGRKIDAVIVSTPDHTHGPASLLALDMGKAVYCQKPLTRHVAEARRMSRIAGEKGLVTQMGIQIHSFKEYRSAVQLIQSGIIGKVSRVHAWSPRSWGYDGPPPEGSDPVPGDLDWNLWQGTAPERPYKKEIYHPVQWRRILDYGGGALGDMGAHIFDTPYMALAPDRPDTILAHCREPNGFAHPEKNRVTYTFPGTRYTTESLTCMWYDGEGAPGEDPDLALPQEDKLPEQGAMFVGERGRFLLPHWDFARLIVEGNYEKLDFPDLEEQDHYHQFIDACLGKGTSSTPFSYSAKLSEVVLLGVAATRFPGTTLHLNREEGTFREEQANSLLDTGYRSF